MKKQKEQPLPKEAQKSNAPIQKKEASASPAVAAAKGRSATKAVKADANTDVRGSSGLANTGPHVSYNDGE